MKTVRNGQKVWPYCSECGCRLEIFENGMFVSLRHFGSFDKDARGHKCSKLDLEWTHTKGLITHLGYC